MFHSLPGITKATDSEPSPSTKNTTRPILCTMSVPVPPEESAYDRWTLKDPSTLDYGYFGSKSLNALSPTSESATGGYYITTAINYTNGPAHMGHAYEAATADVLARFARLRGEEDAYFVTGTDEHGQKVAKTAADQGKEPIEICDTYTRGFQCLNQRILISNDDFIRTTSDRHKRTAQELWKRCAHDIYLDTYSGWYNAREEAFVTDKDAELMDFKDPTSGLPLKQVEEESYFFKMSAYQERLIQHIEENPDFIRPEQHRNLILQRLKTDDLRDLSISRTNFQWGISAPEGFHDHHVMYVWVDALSNYLTGVNGLGVNDAPENLSKFWPANVHIIGKDILWFHTVIWPCLLLSAQVPLPTTIFGHGFVNDKEGKKMSKSMGNVVDPHDMLDKYPVDTLRWYLCKEAPYGGELSFSEDSLCNMHNADLCDTLGNLVHRATNLCTKYCDGVIPDVPTASPIDFVSLVNTYQAKMKNFELENGASTAIHGFRDINKYLTEEAPWLKKGDEFAEFRRSVVRTTLEAIYILTHLLAPFIPVGSAEIFRKLNTEPVSLVELSFDGHNLKEGTPIEIGEVLYSKILSEEELTDAKEAARKKNLSHAEAQRIKKKKKAKQNAESKAGQAEGAIDQPEFTKMDIRVGEITKVWYHPAADKLFCEEVEVGDETGPRQIVSGLRGHYELDEMQGKKVLVVCNLKSSKLVGVDSNGMVLAAKDEHGSKVELIDPPAGAAVGERVFIKGLTGDPLSAAQVKKRKTWEAVTKGLRTGDGGVATWEDKILLASTGACSAASLVDAPIS